MSDDKPDVEARVNFGRPLPPLDTRFGGPRGNPIARPGVPKGFLSISQACKDILSWPVEVKNAFLAEGGASIPVKYRRKLRPAHDIARAQILRAEDPDNRSGVAATEAIADRTEGKVSQKIETASVQIEEELRAAYERRKAREKAPR